MSANLNINSETIAALEAERRGAPMKYTPTSYERAQHHLRRAIDRNETVGMPNHAAAALADAEIAQALFKLHEIETSAPKLSDGSEARAALRLIRRVLTNAAANPTSTQLAQIDEILRHNGA